MSGPSRTWRIVVIACIGTLLVGSGVAYGVFRATNLGSSSKQGSEVLLQPGANGGPDPFMASVATTAPAVAGTPSPAPAQNGGPVRVASTRGSTPGLYGGTEQQGTCNTDQLTSYLRQNPGKASAWVQALDSDPGMRWSGGSKVRVDQIDQYSHELTSVLLRTDSRVTNHGYRNGSVTTFASVLQAGTAVLVDQYGVPRARCACGNPLTSPTSVTGSVAFVGQRWKTFNSSSLVVIAPSTTIINNFVVVNVNNGSPFARPSGGTGASDAQADPASAASAVAAGNDPAHTAPSSPPGSNPVAGATPATTTSPPSSPGAQSTSAPTPTDTNTPGATQPPATQAPHVPAPATTTTPTPETPATPTPTPAVTGPAAPTAPTTAPTTTPSTSATPDLTPFVGTWTGAGGVSLKVDADGTGMYTGADGNAVKVTFTDATGTTATGTKGGAPFNLMLQGDKLQLLPDGTTLTKGG